MKYYIEIIYDTGDSFHHYSDQVSEVGELEWENLDVAKQNLAYLQQHYTHHLDLESFGRLHYSQQELAAKRKTAEDAVWYNKSYPDRSMNMYTDDGVRTSVSTFWTGYFETLRTARIRQRVYEPDQNDMEYNP